MRGTLLTTGFLAATLCGCAAPHVDADLSHITMVAGPKCNIARIATVPLVPWGANYEVTAQINGQPARLVLDTGASTVTLNQEAVEALKLEPDHVPRLIVTSGLGGVSKMRMAKADTFELGGFRMHDQIVAVGAMTFGTAQAAEHPAGLLGAGYLQAFDLELDFAAQTMSLYGSRHCDDGFLPWQPPFDTIPIQVQPSGHILLKVTLNGTPINAILDTGAAATTISAQAAAALGITAETLAQDRQREIGANGPNRVTNWIHTFQTLSIGRETIQKPTFLISPADLPVAPMLIGLDFLRNYRVWISYGSNRLYLSPTARPAAS